MESSPSTFSESIGLATAFEVFLTSQVGVVGRHHRWRLRQHRHRHRRRYLMPVESCFSSGFGLRSGFWISILVEAEPVSRRRYCCRR